MHQNHTVNPNSEILFSVTSLLVGDNENLFLFGEIGYRRLAWRTVSGGGKGPRVSS